MKRNYFLPLLLTLLTLFLFSSCATIIHGTTQQVGISSNPSGAEVTINGQNFGKTPITAKLSRKESHLVKISLDGFMPYETTINKSVSGWIAGNIVFGGLIGLGIDAITGGMYKLSPEQVQGELRQSGISARLENDRVYISVVLSPKPGWEKIGQLQPM